MPSELEISVMEPFLEEFPRESTSNFCLPAEDTSVCPSLPKEREGALLKDFHLCRPRSQLGPPWEQTQFRPERRALLQKLVKKNKELRGKKKSEGI